MNILLLTQVLPYPPDSGPKIKTWNLIKHLSRNHRVSLISFVRGDQTAAILNLERYCERVIPIAMKRSLLRDGIALLRSLVSGTPWIILRDDRVEMRRAVDSITRSTKFDVIHADQLNMAPYAEGASAGLRVLDAHNALWQLYRRLWEGLPNGPQKLLWGRESLLLKKYEGRVCGEFDGVLAVSQADQTALEEVMGKTGKVRVVPITIDPEEILPVRRHSGADHILSMGTMFWQPNIEGVLWFAREILPIVRSQRPDVTFDIVGARPPKEITRLAERDDHIHVPGYVENPEDYVHKAGAMIVPILAGSGMRVKILQALAQELPVVTTTIGCEGIAVENGRHLLIADTPEEFARAALRLLADPELGRALGRQGRELIQARYNAHTQLEGVDDAYLAWMGVEKVVAG
jgi:glycosyltransferase involved in cell wall biosynthesis